MFLCSYKGFLTWEYLYPFKPPLRAQAENQVDWVKFKHKYKSWNCTFKKINRFWQKIDPESLRLWCRPLWSLRTERCFKLKKWYYDLKELLSLLQMIIGNGDVIWTVAILCLSPFHFSIKCLLQEIPKKNQTKPKNQTTTKKPNNNNKTLVKKKAFLRHLHQMQNLIIKITRNIENNIMAVSQIDRRHWNHGQNWLCYW